MKKLYRITGIMALICFGLAPWVNAGDKKATAPEKNYTIEVRPGFHAVGVTNSKNRVGEYDTLDEGLNPNLGIKGTFMSGKGNFINFGGSYWENDDNSANVDLDIQRIIENNFEYSRFYHRLTHDQLKGFNGVQRYQTHDGHTHKHIWVTHDDIDAGQDYYLRHSVIENKTKIRIPSLPHIVFRFDYRNEQRQGQKQVMALSKCSSCHVVAMGRRIDEETVDYNPGIRATFGNARSTLLTLDYSFLYRTYDQKGRTPGNWYDEVVHPNGLHVPVGYNPYTNPSVSDPGHIFDDRVQYQDDKLPFNRIPDSDRTSHSFKADLWSNPIATEAYGGFTYTNVENQETSNAWDTKVFTGRITNLSIPNLSISARYRWLDIDNDDQYVDTNEPILPSWTAQLGKPSPMPGMTYRDYYDYNPDFNRQSAMNRTVHQANFDARYRVGRHLTLRAGYEWKETDRSDWPEHAYSPDEEYTKLKTTDNTFKIGATGRYRRANATIRYTHRHSTDEIVNYRAAGETLFKESTLFRKPFHPRWMGEQYPERQARRVVDLSGIAEDSDEIFARVAYHIHPKMTAYGFFKWTDRDNDYGWSYTAYMPSVALDIAINECLSFTLSYAYYWQKYNTDVWLPIFDG